MSRRHQPGRHRAGPDVTITAPGRPPVDLGSSKQPGGRAERRRPAFSDRPFRPAVLVAVLAAGVGLLVGPVVVAAARHRGPPELHLDGSQAVYLVLSGEAPASLRLQATFRLVDASRGPVTVLGATVSGSLLRGVRGPLAELKGHDAAQVALGQSVVCRPHQPPVVPVPAARMVLRLRTPTGRRTVRLALPPEPARSIALELARRCGWMPVAEAVRLRQGRARRLRAELLLPLELSSSSARPVRVTGLAAVSPDVEVRLVGGRLPLQLAPSVAPRPLAAGAVARAELLLAFRVTAAACAHGRQPAPTGVLVRVSADQGPGSGTQVLHPPDETGALRGLRCR